jgi:hypothetical protein
LPPLVTAPATDCRNKHQRERDDIAAVTFPELAGAFSADFLVDFVKDIGHANSPVGQFTREVPAPRAGTGEIWRRRGSRRF